MEFEVSIRPTAEKPLLEGSGTLGDVTIIMGRPRTGKSLFLRYLFALFSEDYELAMRTSEQILDDGGWAKLRVGNILLSCSKSDGGEVGCDITPHPREEAYLFYEGVVFTLKYRLMSPESAEVTNAMARLLERIARYREGRWRYDVAYSYGDKKFYERVGGRQIDLAFASAAVVTVGVLERAFCSTRGFCLTALWMSCFPRRCFTSLAGLLRLGRVLSWRRIRRGFVEFFGATATWRRRRGCLRRISLWRLTSLWTGR
jgi:hypothetical protein